MDLEMSKMTAKGQITLPVAIRKSLGLMPGDKVGFVREGEEIRLVNVSSLILKGKEMRPDTKG
jgi:AbrB family looped-hinge helix DNA binding protein